MCIVGNPIILHCQIISFPPKKEKENGIMEFLNLFIYIYIQKIHSGWGLFHESNKGFPRLWNSTFFSPQKKKRLWNWTVRSDEVNRKPFTKTVLLTSKTSIYEKFNEPCKSRFSLTDLKTVDGYGSPKFSWFRVFFFFGYLQTQPLMKLQPQTLRSQYYLFLFLFSVSLTFSFCIFCELLFLHFLFLCVFFVCCFCNFLPPCVFPLKSSVLWSLWRWLTIYEPDKNYSKFP